METSTREKPICDLPVNFGGVSIGKETARLSVKIDRQQTGMSPNEADDLFCGHRLNCKVVQRSNDDDPNQTTMVADLYEEVEGHADVKRMGVSASHIGIGLTWSLADVDVKTLALFSKAAGHLVVFAVATIPEDAPSHDADGDDDDLADTLRGAGPWRDVPMSDLLPADGAICKALTKAGLATVGQLHDYTASDKRLTDVPGIGEGKAGTIEERLIEFWEAYDEPESEAE